MHHKNVPVTSEYVILNYDKNNSSCAVDETRTRQRWILSEVSVLCFTHLNIPIRNVRNIPIISQL